MAKKTNRIKKLTIIIVSYNTKDILKNCLSSIEKVKGEVDFDVIVSDNGSIDESVEMVKREFKWVKVIESAHFKYRNKILFIFYCKLNMKFKHDNLYVLS